MAEILKQLATNPLALAPTTPTPPVPEPVAPIALAEAMMTVTDLDALGRKTVYQVPLPMTANYAEMTVPQKILVLKAGRFSKLPVPLVLSAIVYAAQIRVQTGAAIDELQGDLYAVSNRAGEITFNLTNKAKIKIANATGRIRGVTIETVELVDEPIELDGCDATHDLECTVTLEIAGLTKPIVKVQRLSEWFVKSNPNWQGRPRHMLELNTYAHACEYVFPTDTGEDEVPPASESPFPGLPGTEGPTDTRSLVDKLAASVEALGAPKKKSTLV